MKSEAAATIQERSPSGRDHIDSSREDKNW